uniref:ZP domain-containing protein n=1 Tax=Bursaphelenchus xylophilus TaxID=6326 RepID=A0A1I7SU22_BURXY
MMLCAILLTLASGIHAIDYFDNSMAKTCHPVALPVDLMFILDGSGSVGGPTFDRQLEVLNRIIDVAEIGPQDVQISVMQYSTYTYVEFPFKQYTNRDTIKEVVGKLKHRSGTTKTGKALEKALTVFASKSSGSRFGQKGVKQLAVIVCDGHSHDDPLKPALKLRNAGIEVITLGVGPHINKEELELITGDSNLAFDNITIDSVVDRFLKTFKEAAVGEQCEFLRGEQGAEIDCFSDSIKVSVTMEKDFYGKLYVDGKSEESGCYISNNSTDLQLNIPLTNCNIKHQFTVNPKGHAFEANLILQFHPLYRTAKDRKIKAHCFYQDKNEFQNLDWDLIKEHTQRKHDTRDESLPCKYTIETIERKQNDVCVSNQVLYLGEMVQHKFECLSERFDAYQNILVHSCDLIDLKTNNSRQLVDHNGCSTEPALFSTPVYQSPMKAIADGVAFRFPDARQVRIQCEIQFCDKLMTECDMIIPPKCDKASTHIKRQAGFRAALRPLSVANDDSQPLVTFRQQEKHKKFNVRRRGGIEQSVYAHVITKESDTRRRVPTPVDVKVQTQNFMQIDDPVLAKEISTLKELASDNVLPVADSFPTTELKPDKVLHAKPAVSIGRKPFIITPEMEKAREVDFEKIREAQKEVKIESSEELEVDRAINAFNIAFASQNISPASEIPVEPVPATKAPCRALDCSHLNKDSHDKSSITEDPFQDQIVEGSGQEGPTQLDPELLSVLSQDQIRLQSDILDIQEAQTLNCKFRQ